MTRRATLTPLHVGRSKRARRFVGVVATVAAFALAGCGDSADIANDAPTIGGIADPTAAGSTSGSVPSATPSQGGDNSDALGDEEWRQMGLAALSAAHPDALDLGVEQVRVEAGGVVIDTCIWAGANTTSQSWRYRIVNGADGEPGLQSPDVFRGDHCRNAAMEASLEAFLAEWETARSAVLRNPAEATDLAEFAHRSVSSAYARFANDLAANGHHIRVGFAGPIEQAWVSDPEGQVASVDVLRIVRCGEMPADYGTWSIDEPVDVPEPGPENEANTDVRLHYLVVFERGDWHILREDETIFVNCVTEPLPEVVASWLPELPNEYVLPR